MPNMPIDWTSVDWVNVGLLSAIAFIAALIGNIGDRSSARQKSGIGRNLLHHIALAGAARPKLHEVVVPLRQGNEPHEEE